MKWQTPNLLQSFNKQVNEALEKEPSAGSNHETPQIPREVLGHFGVWQCNSLGMQKHCCNCWFDGSCQVALQANLQKPPELGINEPLARSDTEHRHLYFLNMLSGLE